MVYCTKWVVIDDNTCMKYTYYICYISVSCIIPDYTESIEIFQQSLPRTMLLQYHHEQLSIKPILLLEKQITKINV